MPTEKSYRNPMALYALLVSLPPFLFTLLMLAVQFGVGPTTLLYQIVQAGGNILFGVMVIGMALSVVAKARTEGHRDWRVTTAFLLQALSVAGIVTFILNT